MNMKLTNVEPKTINQIQFEIAQKVLNDWLDASGFDLVTELYLTKFKSNYITWEGRMKFLKESQTFLNLKQNLQQKRQTEKTKIQNFKMKLIH